MQRSFHFKKISQLKSDIRSCRYKNIRLKQTSSGLKKVVVLFWGGGGGGGPATPTLTLNPPLKVKVTSGLAAV